MAMQEDMEKATGKVGTDMKAADKAAETESGTVCTCPECGYSAPMAEFEEREMESESPEGETGEPKPGMEVQIEVGKPRLMSAREAAERAFRGGKK